MFDDSNPGASERPSGDHPFAMVQTDIARDRTLPPHVKLVYVAIASYADEKRVAWPSQETIALDTGLSERAVRKAIKQGADAGLWTVIRTQTSNRYQLRDLKVGGYVLGAGPLPDPTRHVVPDGNLDADPFGIPPGTRCRSDRQDVPVQAAHGADEQDQRTRPKNKTISTSSDASQRASDEQARRRESRTSRIEIFVPKSYDAMDVGDVAQHLVKASVSSLRAAGVEMSEEGVTLVGRSVKHALTNEGVGRHQVIPMLELSLARVGTDCPEWGHLGWRIEETA